MDDDQQFCLRWNNHQSTLISQFDTLLENETLVDCTLAAEGKYLRAHKVVLSACSPYFESLLRLQYDKHPIFILKDVKYQELRAMMDYMYRGEVNISQDQLGALLKAAESLQIKGLSDSKGGEKRQQPPPRQSSPIPTPSSSKTLTVSKQSTRSATTVSNDIIVGPPSPINARESSATPPPRKRKKLRRRSQDDEMTDNHDNHSNSSNHSQPTNSPTIPLPILPITKASSDDDQMVDETIPLVPSTSSSTEQNIVEKSNSNISNVKIKESPVETHSEIMIEPKAEYVDDVNEDSVEDLTLDDEDLEDMDQSQAGPSHAGEGSSQGFGAWHMGGDRTQDEVFMAAQDATSGHRDTQDLPDDFCGEVEYLDEGLDDEERNLLEGQLFESRRNQQTNYVISESYMDETGAYIFTPSGFPIDDDYDEKPIILTKNNKPRKFPLHMMPRYKRSPYSSSKCPQCGKVYSLYKNMKRHLTLECGKEPQFQCGFCPTKCKRNNQLKNHIRLKHSVQILSGADVPEFMDSDNDQYID